MITWITGLDTALLFQQCVWVTSEDCYSVYAFYIPCLIKSKTSFTFIQLIIRTGKLGLSTFVDWGCILVICVT